MSKYTTQVRFICEQKAGLNESGTYADVDTVINETWNSIFITQAAFFDPTYKPIICKKILKHYYLREIGAETVGIWLLWMNTRLEEILPYYNKLWASAILEFDPFKDVDYTRTGQKSADNKENQAGSFTRNDSTDTLRTPELTDTTTHGRNTTDYDLFSDTPQGSLSGVENQTYLTSADKSTSAESGQTVLDRTGSEAMTGSSEQTGTNTNSTTGESTEAYTERIAGKMNSTPYSELLLKLRETFINIDMLVINEFADLFFNLW